MKKSTRLIKRFAALFLVVLMSIDGFGAIVGDSDGGAFVTKKEFEDLKAEFDRQIDRYNNSLAEKIEGAIAAYLAGRGVVEPIEEPILNNTWDDVSSVNGVFENEWNIPEFIQMFELCHHTATFASEAPLAGGWYKFLTAQMSSRITQQYSTAGTNKRNLVTNKGTNAAPTNITWNGRALKYHEMYFLIRTAYVRAYSPWDLAWLDRPASAHYRMFFRNFFRLAAVGDLTGLKTNTKALWPFIMRWEHDYGGTWSGTQGDWDQMTRHDTLQTSVTLEKNSNNKTKEYEHIISYNGNDQWRLFNQNENYSNSATESGLDSDDIHAVGALHISQKAMVFGLYSGGNSAVTTSNKYNYDGYMEQLGQEIGVTMDTTTNTIFPNLGILPSKYKSNQIYQDDVTREIEVDKDKVEKKPVTLEKGFQLLAGKYGDIVEWNPVFSYTHVHNGAITYATDNTHEVDIYFSSVPFTDKVNTTNRIKVQVGTNTTLKDYATTSSRKCKIKFTMPHTGLVYVKFVPHFTGTSYIDKDWILTLNLSKCNTYTYIRE